jgi:hypothetical protein
MMMTWTKKVDLTQPKSWKKFGHVTKENDEKLLD